MCCGVIPRDLDFVVRSRIAAEYALTLVIVSKVIAYMNFKVHFFNLKSLPVFIYLLVKQEATKK